MTAKKNPKLITHFLAEWVTFEPTTNIYNNHTMPDPYWRTQNNRYVKGNSFTSTDPM